MISVLRWLLAALAATGGLSYGASLFQVSGEPGSSVFAGRQLTVTDADGTFRVSNFGTGVSATFSSPGHNLFVSFANVTGQPLVVGTYERSRDIATATHPQMGIGLDGAGCQGVGRFVVRDLQRDASSAITVFAVDFEFHCGASTRAIFGGVRINSSIPYAQMTPLPQAATFFQLAGQTGSYLLNGQQRSFAAADGSFAPQLYAGGQQISFIPLSGVGRWTITVANAAGKAPLPGTYENALGVYNTQGLPAVEISGDGTDCSPQTARFVVRDIQSDDDGLLLSAAFDIEMLCGPGWVYAGARFNSSIPYSDPMPAPLPTFVQFGGEPGDFILGSAQKTYTSADSQIGAGSNTLDRVNVIVHGSDGQLWNFDFANATGLTLVAGTYEQAGRYTGAPTSYPTLSISGDHRGCGAVAGRFVVLEVTRGPANAIISFAADFEQHCDGAQPALRGGVRINSSVPFAPYTAPPPSTDPTFLQLSSQAHEIILQGQQRSIASSDGTFALFPYNDGHIAGVVTNFTTNQLVWSLLFASADGQPLRVGKYENASYFVFDGASHPTIVVSREGHVCNFTTGRFVVLQAVYDAGGFLLKLAVDFEQHCNGETPALFGGLRFSSSVPYVGPALASIATRLEYVDASTVTIPAGSMSPPLRVRTVTDSGAPIPNSPVRYKITQENCGIGSGITTYAYTIVVSDANGIASDPPLPVGNFAATCVISAELIVDGTASLPFTITVEGPATPPPPPPPQPPSASWLTYNVPNYAFQRVGTSLAGPQVVTRSDAGNAVQGASVRFTIVGACGTFKGIAAPSVDVASNTSGVAIAPDFTIASSGVCQVTAQLANGVMLTFSYNGYVPSELALTPTPLTVTVGLNQKTTVGFVLSLRGTYMSGMPVTFRVDPPVAGGPSLFPTTSATNSSGLALTELTASGAEMAYRIVGEVDNTALGVIQVSQRSTPAVQRVTGASPYGAGAVSASIAGGKDCAFTDYRFMTPEAAGLPPPPTSVALIDGVMSLSAANCPVGGQVTMSLEYSLGLPPTAAFWRYGPTPDNRAAHWYVTPAVLSGHSATLPPIVDGGAGDDDLIANGSLTIVGGLATPGGTLQDLWWSGSAENGWGMSLVQHGGILFAIIYAYDGAGNPTWYAMPGGTWNSTHTAYSGSLYRPHGSPYFNYSASRLDIGAAAGSVTISWIDSDNASLDYTIGGVSGHKTIQRQIFGAVDPTINHGAHADMWWGGSAQSGWGIAVLQQYATLFAAWFTYDASGAPMWFVMPGGTWAASDTYEGRVFRTTSSPWLGVQYDASRLQAIDVGLFRLHFNGDTASVDYSIEGHSGTLPLSRQPF